MIFKDTYGTFIDLNILTQIILMYCKSMWLIYTHSTIITFKMQVWVRKTYILKQILVNVKFQLTLKTKKMKKKIYVKIPMLRNRKFTVAVTKPSISIAKLLITGAKKYNVLKHKIFDFKEGQFLSGFKHLKHLPPGYWMISVNGRYIYTSIDSYLISTEDLVEIQYCLAKFWKVHWT